VCRAVPSVVGACRKAPRGARHPSPESAKDRQVIWRASLDNCGQFGTGNRRGPEDKCGPSSRGVGVPGGAALCSPVPDSAAPCRAAMVRARQRSPGRAVGALWTPAAKTAKAANEFGWLPSLGHRIEITQVLA
jgi:hypothetical protein